MRLSPPSKSTTTPTIKQRLEMTNMDFFRQIQLINEAYAIEHNLPSSASSPQPSLSSPSSRCAKPPNCSKRTLPGDTGERGELRGRYERPCALTDAEDYESRALRIT